MYRRKRNAINTNKLNTNPITFGGMHVITKLREFPAKTVAQLLYKRFSRLSRAPLGPRVDPMTWIFRIKRATLIMHTTVHVGPPLQVMTPYSIQLAL